MNNHQRIHPQQDGSNRWQRAPHESGLGTVWQCSVGRSGSVARQHPKPRLRQHESRAAPVIRDCPATTSCSASARTCSFTTLPNQMPRSATCSMGLLSTRCCMNHKGYIPLVQFELSLVWKTMGKRKHSTVRSFGRLSSSLTAQTFPTGCSCPQVTTTKKGEDFNTTTSSIDITGLCGNGESTPEMACARLLSLSV